MRDRSRSPRRGGGGQPSPEDVCTDWNWRQGRCAGRSNHCPLGWVHNICSHCMRTGHRACDSHGNQKGKGKGKDKGKKGKGKNKNGKNKDNGEGAR